MGLSIDRAYLLRQRLLSLVGDVISTAKCAHWDYLKIHAEVRERIALPSFKRLSQADKAYVRGYVDGRILEIERHDIEWRHWVPEGWLYRGGFYTSEQVRYMQARGYADIWQAISAANPTNDSKSNYFWKGTDKPWHTK